MKNRMRRYLEVMQKTELTRRIGYVKEYFGLVIEAEGPAVFLGERCEIEVSARGKTVTAEVVGLRRGSVMLMAFGQTRGISVGCRVIATGRPIEVGVGEQLLGRVVDGFGRPLDGAPMGKMTASYPLYGSSINPLERPRIGEVLETGVRAIDGLLTIGKGQRVGIFAGSGVGKSALLGMIARNMNADVNVIALVGERGREVMDFVEDSLGEDGLARSVVVVATSDQTALERSHAALAATAIAEYFRDIGKDVVLMMDSVTRFATAYREIGLAVGEPPTARGYTPSVFNMLPKLLERGGKTKGGGSITGLYTVLVDGDDMNDPIADSVRSILDGHIVLSRELANHGHFPPIDILQSNSRLMAQLIAENELELVRRAVRALSTYEKSRDMIEVGAYKRGSNMELDRSIAVVRQLTRFLTQAATERSARAASIKGLQDTFVENEYERTAPTRTN